MVEKKTIRRSESYHSKNRYGNRAFRKWVWLKSEITNYVFCNSVKEIRVDIGGFIDSVLKIPEVVIIKLCVIM